jgi:spore maturation protein CgeB
MHTVKVLFVAVFSDTSTNNSQSRGFRNAGAEVIEYNYRVKAKELGSDTLRDLDIVDVCKTEQPDLVVFSKCNGVHSAILAACNAVCNTCLWYMDPMGNFDMDLIMKVREATFSIFALDEPYQEAHKRRPDKVFFLQEGFDPLTDRPLDDLPYLRDVAFIGHPREHRRLYIDSVGADVITNAYGEEHAAVVATTKINLNFTHGGTSDRTYKVLAARGFLLTQPWPGMEKDFTPGVDFGIFESVQECQEQVANYLLDDELRDRIRWSGYNTVQKFNRNAWAMRILQINSGFPRKESQ